MASGSTTLLCSFWLGEHAFGVGAASVREISSQTVFTPIPLAPAAVRGYVNLRGQLYLALDMRVLLGLSEAEPQAEGHLIVFEPTAGESFGVFVDRIGDIVEVDEDQIDRPKCGPGESGGTVLADAHAAGLIAGIVKLDTGLMTVVDPGEFLRALGHTIRVEQGTANSFDVLKS